MKDFAKFTIGCFIALQALTVQAQGIVPKHVQLGQDLVLNIPPENNEYSNSRRLVRFPGDLFSSGYSVHTDCTGFVEAMLDRAYGYQPAFSTKKFKDRFSIIDYVDGIERDESFKRIPRVDDLRVGDVVAWKLLKKPATRRTNGHIVLVSGTPKKLETSRRSGLTQWDIPILDSTTGPTGPDDTRMVKGEVVSEDSLEGAEKSAKRTGAGAGRIQLYSDAVGNLVAMSYSFHNSKIYNHGDQRYFVMGRLPEKVARQ